MLKRLRHYALIRGHDQPYRIDPGHPGEHISDEIAVPWDINNPHFAPARQH